MWAIKNSARADFVLVPDSSAKVPKSSDVKNQQTKQHLQENYNKTKIDNYLKILRNNNELTTH